MTALCSECGRRVSARDAWDGGRLFLEKTCPVHGIHRALVATDANYWLEVRRVSLAASKADVPTSTKPLMVFLDVIDECDLACSTCIADSLAGSGNQRDPSELVARVQSKVAGGQLVDLLLLTGGEPTLHADLPRIIRDLAPFTAQVVVITNGQRIAHDSPYVDELRAASDKLHVYLQFDSLSPKALIHLRGSDLSEVRTSAVANLGRCSIPTTLISVIKRGVNDDDIIPTVAFALAHKHVLGVTFQPVRATGRHATFDYNKHHITLTEIRRTLVQGLGLTESCIRPHPADPYRVALGYFCRESRTDLTAMLWESPENPATPLYVTPRIQQTGVTSDRPFRVAVVSYYDQYDFVLDADRPQGIVFLSDQGEYVTLEERFLNGTDPTRPATHLTEDTTMTDQSPYCVVLTTTSNEQLAEDLAKKIVGAKLGACVQVQQIKSYYMWKGEACVEPECLLFIKARSAQYKELESFIKANHSYETPEIVQLPIQAGHPAYLNWMSEVTSG